MINNNLPAYPTLGCLFRLPPGMTTSCNSASVFAPCVPGSSYRQGRHAQAEVCLSTCTHTLWKQCLDWLVLCQHSVVGEMKSLICSFYLSLAPQADFLIRCVYPWDTACMLLGHSATKAKASLSRIWELNVWPLDYVTGRGWCSGHSWRPAENQQVCPTQRQAARHQRGAQTKEGKMSLHSATSIVQSCWF